MPTPRSATTCGSSSPRRYRRMSGLGRRPVSAAFGSRELKERFLSATANLDIWWCQGFSEPEAGSDLAAVRTTAVRDGDSYVINGQKTWTTLGQYADWIFLLARTNPDAPKR